jgi:Flp pilus assembly protein TadG
MHRLLHNEDGVGAIEFALIVPMLLIVLLGFVALWSAIAQSDNMQDSVEAAATYLIHGGTDDNKAVAIAESSWRNRPDDGVVSLSRSCTCSGAAATCTDPCPVNELPPHIEITIQATSTWTSPVPVIYGESSRTLVQQEIVRVR